MLLLEKLPVSRTDESDADQAVYGLKELAISKWLTVQGSLVGEI